ncbi:hypothetical protein [Shimia sp.]|uniref:hypothetical protein n=1 Tax=Shimia sp. TaxID=1954381 RepID=UPI00356AC3A2
MKFLTLLALSISLALPAAQAVAADSDGCYFQPRTTGDARWSKYDDDKLIVTITNRENSGVYVKVCIKRKSGSDDCGASWIRAGKSETFSAYDAHSTGSYGWYSVGSQNRDASWVCSGKTNGWHTDMNL